MLYLRVDGGQQLGLMLSQTDTVCRFISCSLQIRPHITHQPRLGSLRGLVSWSFLIEISYSFLIFASGTMYILIDINKSK